MIAVLKQNKVKIAVLIVLQIIFLASLFTIGIDYQLKIVSNIQGIVGPLQAGNYDPTAMDGTMIQDSFQIVRNFNALKQNLLHGSLLLLSLFLLLNGGLWMLTLSMFRKVNLKDWLSFTSITIIALIPLLIIVAIVWQQMLNLAINPENVRTWIDIIATLAAISYYFLSVGFVFTNKSGKEIVHKIKTVGLSLSTLKILFINVAVIGVILYFVYLALTTVTYSPLIIPATFLFVLALVGTRINWVYNLCKK